MELPPHDRLCSWLGLPAGSWPPDHYALLDLTRGAGDISDIEERVLDRMERLRHHQLLQPELVTEGMNRLAQAMVCLTDRDARVAYDRSLGIAPPPFEVVEDEPGSEWGELEEVPFESAKLPPGETQQPAYEVVEETQPYEVVYFELVEDKPRAEPVPSFPALEVAPSDEFVPVDESRKPELPASEWAGVAESASRPSSSPEAQINRRTIYKRLAAVRKAIRAWDGLRAVFGTPTEPLATPVAVLMFVQALARARAALPGVRRLIRGPGTPGGTVATLVRLPHVLHTVRTLVPSQREAVALDWQRGYETLRRGQARLRQMAIAARPRRRDTEFVRLFRAVYRTPECVLFLVAFFALVLALLRRNS